MTPKEQEKFNESTLNFFRDIDRGIGLEIHDNQELLMDMAETYEIPLLALVRYKMYEEEVWSEPLLPDHI